MLGLVETTTHGTYVNGVFVEAQFLTPEMTWREAAPGEAPDAYYWDQRAFSAYYIEQDPIGKDTLAARSAIPIVFTDAPAITETAGQPLPTPTGIAPPSVVNPPPPPEPIAPEPPAPEPIAPAVPPQQPPPAADAPPPVLTTPLPPASYSPYAPYAPEPAPPPQAPVAVQAGLGSVLSSPWAIGLSLLGLLIFGRPEPPQKRRRSPHRAQRRRGR